MRKVIYAVILMILLEGCAKDIPIVINDSVVKEISKDMALEYLNELTKKYPSPYYSSTAKCKFYEDHVSYRRRVNTLLSDNDYIEIRLDYEKVSFEFWSDFRYEKHALAMRLNGTLFSPGHCGLAWVGGFQTKNDPEMVKLANKVATALYSLGVKMEK